MNLSYSIRSQWMSALRFCVFAIMPIGGLFHYLVLRVWLAFIFSPIVILSAGLAFSHLGASLTEYELTDTRIKKRVLGRVVGVLKYSEIERVRLRENKWCYVKGNRQTFFFLPKMEGYEDCIQLLGQKLDAVQKETQA